MTTCVGKMKVQITKQNGTVTVTLPSCTIIVCKEPGDTISQEALTRAKEAAMKVIRFLEIEGPVDFV